MKIQMKGSGVKLTPAIKDYVQAKIDMLEKFLGDINPTNCDFEIELTTKHHLKGEIFRAEINMTVPGELLRVEKAEKDMYKAIDKVKDHMARSIKKYKDKKISGKK